MIIYDDEQGYLAGVLADHLSSKGIVVTFVTPASVVSPWTESTLEQKRVQKALISAGVKIVCNSLIEKIEIRQPTLNVFSQGPSQNYLVSLWLW